MKQALRPTLTGLTLSLAACASQPKPAPTPEEPVLPAADALQGAEHFTALGWQDEPAELRELSTVSQSFATPDGGHLFAAQTWLPATDDEGETPTYNYGPVLVRRARGTRNAFLDLRTELRSFEWTSAYVDTKSGAFFGALEYTVEGPMTELNVVLSDDGRDFFLSQAPKPHFLALFYGAKRGPAPGSWTVYEQEDDKFFRATTLDGGRNWKLEPCSKPEALASVLTWNASDTPKCGSNQLRTKSASQRPKIAKACRLP